MLSVLTVAQSYHTFKILLTTNIVFGFILHYVKLSLNTSQVKNIYFVGRTGNKKIMKYETCIIILRTFAQS